jgi:cytochrome c oxidase assembly protein subunit 11
MSATSLRDPAAGRVWWLVGLGGFAIGVMVFFLFGYSSFYSLWCKITGTGMNPNNPETAAVVVPEGEGREIEVFFEAKAYDRLPVRFYPNEPRIVARVGHDSTVIYRFKNLSDEPVRYRPIHQVSPLLAGQHFSMKMCFCFNDQVLGPGESTEYPVVFSFGPGIDPRITSVTVRYSLHRIRDGEGQSEWQKRIEQQLDAAGALSGDAKTVTPGFEKLDRAVPAATDGATDGAATPAPATGATP